MRTAEEAERLLALKKVVGEPIVWEPQDGAEQRFRFKVRALSLESDDILWLAGSARIGNWGYVLIARANWVLRKVSTPHAGHRNRDGSVADPRHKHTWTEADDNAAVYMPDDIRWESGKLALLDFAAECKITLLHDVPAVPFQGKLL